jgi:hypothetical protein
MHTVNIVPHHLGVRTDQCWQLSCVGALYTKEDAYDMKTVEEVGN